MKVRLIVSMEIYPFLLTDQKAINVSCSFVLEKGKYDLMIKALK